MAGQIIRSW